MPGIGLGPGSFSTFFPSASISDGVAFAAVGAVPTAAGPVPAGLTSAGTAKIFFFRQNIGQASLLLFFRCLP